MTRALLTRKDQMVKKIRTSIERNLFIICRARIIKEWGQGYRHPGLESGILAFFLENHAEIGPVFRALQFKNSTTQTEDM